MLEQPNALQWNGKPGHYEVYYVTVTEPATGIGLWIRYTMVAPLERTGEPATCALWLLAMDPRPATRGVIGRKATFPIADLHSETNRFELLLAGATLTDRGMAGELKDVGWELSWDPAARHYEHVHESLRRAGVAQTVLVLPHVDGVSVFVSRLGRELGPNTPVVGRIAGEDFSSTSPLRVVRNDSTFALTGWRFEAIDGRRKLIGEIDADRDLLAGVTYHDPDGELAYCYNSETASTRVQVYERARRVGGWAHRETLVAPGRAHFEYAQRTPLEGLELLTT